MKTYQVLTFPYFSDERGETVPFELDERFPFAVRRVYLVTGKDSAQRGGHAHTHEQEVFVAVSGSVKVWVSQDGKSEEILLQGKNKGLFVPAYCWHELYDFSPTAVVLAFSSTHYQGRDGYLENKEDFLRKA